MARYVYTHSIGGKVVDYAESTAKEDMMDEVGDTTLVGFTGNGYLAFWKRCKDNQRKIRMAYASLRGIDLSAIGIDVEIPEGEEEAVVTDLYTGEEKQI